MPAVALGLMVVLVPMLVLLRVVEPRAELMLDPVLLLKLVLANEVDDAIDEVIDLVVLAIHGPEGTATEEEDDGCEDAIEVFDAILLEAELDGASLTPSTSMMN